MSINHKDTLPKPPRLLSNQNGYDWNEFDRWIQRLYLLLGMPDANNSKALNVLASLNDQEVSNSFDFSVDHQQEIKTLDRRIDDVIVELNLISSNKELFKSVSDKINDLTAEINMSIDHQQEIRSLQQQINDTNTANAIGVFNG